MRSSLLLHAYIHTHICTYKYSLLSPFRAHMCICLGLTTWEWIPYGALVPREDSFFISAAINCLHIGVKPCKIPPSTLACQRYNYTGLVWANRILRFHDCHFPVIHTGQRHSRHPGLLVLTVFPPSLPDVPGPLGAAAVLQMCLLWLAPRSMVSAF